MTHFHNISFDKSYKIVQSVLSKLMFGRFDWHAWHYFCRVLDGRLQNAKALRWYSSLSENSWSEWVPSYLNIIYSIFIFDSTGTLESRFVKNSMNVKRSNQSYEIKHQFIILNPIIRLQMNSALPLIFITLPVKAYFHSERFRLKFLRESPTLRGF